MYEVFEFFEPESAKFNSRNLTSGGVMNLKGVHIFILFTVFQCFLLFSGFGFLGLPEGVNS